MAVPIFGGSPQRADLPPIGKPGGKLLPVAGNFCRGSHRPAPPTRPPNAIILWVVGWVGAGRCRAKQKWPVACSVAGMSNAPDLLQALGAYLDPTALGIVAGGTIVAVILRTPLRDLGRAISALRVLPRRRFDAGPLLDQIASLGRIARRHGTVALDRTVIADPDVAAAVAAIVDARPISEMAAAIGERRRARIERHAAAADVWSQAADVAPAMGMIGTLIGLVRMFTAMNDPTTIGGAMAVALLTTLYGAAIASLIAQPIANRLRRRGREEAIERLRLEAPLIALAERERPRVQAIREAQAA